MDDVEPPPALLVGEVLREGGRATGTALQYRGVCYAVGECVLMHHTEVRTVPAV